MQDYRTRSKVWPYRVAATRTAQFEDVYNFCAFDGLVSVCDGAEQVLVWHPGFHPPNYGFDALGVH